MYTVPEIARKAAGFAACLLWLLVAGCQQPQTEADAYWIWAGIEISPQVQSVPLYLYQGLLSQGAQGPRLQRRGYAPHPTASPALYLVFRLETLDDSPRFPAAAARLCADWEQQGNHVAGVQLDFDAPSAQLLHYSNFLERFRAQLPKRYRLSVTGLGDWLFSAEAGVLERISASVDEVVFQLYQKRQPLPDTDKYLAKMRQLKFPFKIGQLAADSDKISMTDSPYFRGTVYFIQR